MCGKHVDVVAEREERVTCAGKAALLHAFALAEVLGTLAGQQRRINAVGLTRAHANAGLALGDQDGVGLNALADLPGKLELGHLSVGGLAVGGERKGRGILGHVVDLLHQHAAVDGAQLHLGTVVHAAGSQHAQVGALGHALERLIGVARGDDDLDELLVLVGEVLNQLKGNLAVAGDDAAEGALGIAGESAVVGGRDVLGNGGTAGVLMLEDHAGRLVELADQVPGGIGVQIVVVAERLALDLLGAHKRELRARGVLAALGKAVGRSLLLRILTIAQVVDLLQRNLELGRGVRHVACLGGKPTGDSRVVGGGGLVDLHLQATTGGTRGAATGLAHLGQDGIIVGRVGDDGNARGVLGGRAQHGGATDVDVLDGIRKGDLGVGDGLLELVQVDDDQVDQLNAVLSRLLHVLLGIAAGQQRAMNLGVQGLNAAVHHLGIARELLDGGYGNARVLDGTSRAARRDDLDAKVINQRPCEIDDARLIGNRDQRACDLHIRSHAVLLSGTPPCSVSR